MENPADFDIQEWFEAAVDPDAVTVQKFDEYVDEYLTEKAKATKLDDELTEQNIRVMAMSSKLMEYLALMGKTKHVTSKGTINKIETSSWQPPEGEQREAIIQTLKDNGQYDNVMAFNAKKFSSWYAEEKAANPEFKFAGVEAKITKYIRFNKAKG